MTITHLFRCISCEREHLDGENAQKCCPFVQEVFRCDNCLAEFPNEAKARAHQERKPITECEAIAIADGVDAGAIKLPTSWQGPAGCFTR